jgi:hypothetical protein
MGLFKSRPILVSGIQFEVTGKELKDRFEQRVKEIEMFVNAPRKIRLLEKTLNAEKVRLANLKFFASHINIDYVYHVNADELGRYEIVNSLEDLVGETMQ